MAGFGPNGKDNTRRGPLSGEFTIRDILKKISSFGMEYQDMVIRNSQAIGPTENLIGYNQINPTGVNNDDMYAMFAALSLSDIQQRKSIPYFDKGYIAKRDNLRRFSQYDEIEDILDILCDEVIVYNDENQVGSPVVSGLDISKELKDYIEQSYKEIYQYFGFDTGQSLWYFFRKWLIDGYLSFEIIFNDNQDKIIGFKEIEAHTLMPGISKDDGKKVWIQYKDDPVKERVLYDSQIIYIAYASSTTPSRISYLERLVRTFNLLRIMEHTRIIWAVTNASYKMKFIIPVSGKSKNRAKESIGMLMNNYREVVDFDWESGVLETNGKPMMAFNREYWLPSKDGESPEIETVGGDGPDLSDMEALQYFENKLKLASKIPYSRFNKMDGGGNWNSDPESVERDEIKFSKFINRLKSTFNEILLKPLYVQLCIKNPDIAKDTTFKSRLGFNFNSNNMFEERMEMQNMKARVEFIQELKDAFTTIDPESGEEKSFFSQRFLIDKFLKLSHADIVSNDRYLSEDIVKKAELTANDDVKTDEESESDFGLDV